MDVSDGSVANIIEAAVGDFAGEKEVPNITASGQTAAVS
jgi:hypothetical protein